jgi:polyketide synthase 7
VLRAVRELTGDAEASVTASTPLMEAGIDSLAATELSSRLRAGTGLALSPTLVFEQPTPRAIAAHVRSDSRLRCMSSEMMTLCSWL